MVGPGAFMITVTFHGYSVKSYRDHESVALAPHGWAVFRRGAGHTAAVGPRAKGTPVSDLTARSRRGKARKSSRPPVEVGTMDLRRLGNKPAGSSSEQNQRCYRPRARLNRQTACRRSSLAAARNVRIPAVIRWCVRSSGISAARPAWRRWGRACPRVRPPDPGRQFHDPGEFSVLFADNSPES